MAGPSISGATKGFSGAASELFAGFASEAKADMFRTSARLDLMKGEGARLEGESYGRARELSLLNKQFTAASTDIQQAQTDRNVTMALGGIRETYASGGLALEGSALDVLRASASQGELERQVLGMQGLITEAGHQEQADVYANMVKASQVAVDASKEAAAGHERAASAEEEAATGHYIGAAINAVTGIASLFGV